MIKYQVLRVDNMKRQFLLGLIFTGLFIAGCAQDPVSAQDGPIVGDAAAGQRIYIFCQSCHSINEGGSNKVGPNLYGIFGQPAAQAEGFIYSDALSSANITWTADVLDQWITRPAALVPGTTMVFAGVNNPQQRADLIAYLQEAGGSL